MSNIPEVTVSAGSSCSIKPRNLPRAKTIKVNGVAINRGAIARETQNHPAAKPVEAWKSAARALIVRELLLEEAKRQEFTAAPLTDADGRRETSEEASIRGLVDAMVKTPDPDESECRRVYDANKARFRSSDLVEARHILLAAAPNDAVARDSAKALASRLIEQLGLQQSLFSELAAIHSNCPSATTGGSLGQISKGQTVPEFEHALESAPIGVVTPEPVESRYGLHVVLVDRRIDGNQLPFEVVRPQIAAWLVERSRHIGIRAFIADLVRTAKIEGVEFDLTVA